MPISTTTTLSMEGKKLADWRARQVRALEAIRSAALPIDAAWKRQISDVSAGVKNLRKPFNVAFLAILLDAMKWPDISLCSCLLRGFPLAGDLSAQTSNIFEAAASNVILGVEVHLQDFLSECKVSFSPTKKRCEEILLQLRECERRGIITIMEAALVLDRLGFILTASYRSLGRAALQPLIKRASTKKSRRGFTKTSQFWTVDMTYMKDFFQELLTCTPSNFSFTNIQGPR